MKSGPAAPNATSTALAHVPPAKPNVWDDVRYQQLWLATQRRPWRSLAVVGASPDLDTVGVAELLSKIAWWYRGEPSCVFDLRDASLRLVEYQVHEVKMQIDAGLRVILALRSMVENPTAIPLARSADAVVLCVGLGKTEIKAAERTINEIGRDRVLGSIVMKSRGKNGAASPQSPPGNGPGNGPGSGRSTP